MGSEAHCGSRSLHKTTLLLDSWPTTLNMIFRAGLHHEPWSRAMKGGLFPRSDFKVQLPWSNFFFKNQSTKPLDPSLCVNWMWTKRNDCASKSERADFFIYMSKKGSFEKKSSCLIIFLSSLVFIFSSPPKEKLLKIYYNNISLPWALAFFY